MNGIEGRQDVKEARGLVAEYQHFLKEQRVARRFWDHRRVSILKSVVRLLACLSGIWSFAYFAVGFAVAEALGIWEEMGGRG